MQWIKASERRPPDNAIKREISRNEVIPNQHIWKQDDDRIIMSNDYDAVGINGREIMFDNVEWLDETPSVQNGDIEEKKIVEMQIEWYELNKLISEITGIGRANSPEQFRQAWEKQNKTVQNGEDGTSCLRKKNGGDECKTLCEGCYQLFKLTTT